MAAPAATTEELKRRAVELAGIFDRLGKDIRDGGDEQLAAAWREVRGRFERADFTVAVAGEFNRGKTTVVNRLLGLELPVGVLPTTALMTRIGYGPEPRLHYRAPDGRRETLPLSAEAFDRFTAERMGDEAEGLLQVEVPDEWLHSRGLAFVDTPGAGDLSAARAALAARAATRS